jgi:hypothetical protein
VNRKQRRSLNSTGELRCEVCLEYNFLVQHHINGRSIDRANEHHNLANICSNCHVKIHKGEIILEKRVLTTKGYILMWHKKQEESVTGDDSEVYVY